MKKYSLFGLLLVFVVSVTTAQISRATAEEEKNLWKELKRESGFKKIFRKYKKYRFEIVFTQIDHSLTGEVKLKNYYLGDSMSYFYPASLAKLPLAIAIAESVGNEPFLNIDLGMHLRLDTAKICHHWYENGMHEFHRVQKGESLKDIAAKYRISIDDLCRWNKTEQDSIPQPNTSLLVYYRKSRPTLSQLISEMLIYSDNESYNKLFEMMGGQRMQEWMEAKGFEESNVTRKFLYCEGEEMSYAVPFDLLNSRDVIFYHGNGRQWEPVNNSGIPGIAVGKKYYWNDSLIPTPRNFSDHNRILLPHAHEMLQRLIYPQAFALDKQYDMPSRIVFKIIKDLGLYPSEHLHPRDSVYDEMEDGVLVFLFNGNSKEKIQPGLRMVNCIGQAYGFSSDVMYFADDATDTEFFLSLRIYTNKDEILNDDRYEYDEIAMPLMEAVGKYFYEKEKQRKKEIVPSLMTVKSIFD